MKNRDRKKTAGMAAITLALAIALTGTFAWQSISQVATNEAMEELNPGGRLHDDFNGENKDIYVENFTETQNGVPIYARIRLDEYMEIGAEAGKNLENEMADRNVTSVIDGAKSNDKTTWKTHIPGDSDDLMHESWKWSMGGQTTYMPTFNKNKDSIKADINGTYKGEDGTNEHYDDYVDYSKAENASKTGEAVYDNDDNSVEEDVDTEPTSIRTENETHEAKTTIDGTVMTMAEWKAKGSIPGAYWVYDTDGWAYWAQPIEPETATGLLLDKIEMIKMQPDSWYYAINVIAQFVTADSWGKKDNTGFYDTTQGKVPSVDAELLLSKISKEKVINITAADGATAAAAGGTLDFNASVTFMGMEAEYQDVTWTVEGSHKAGTTINTAGLLSVDANETAQQLTIRATSEAYGQHEEVVVDVNSWRSSIRKIEPNTTDTITIDGISWYVLAKSTDNNSVLIWSAEYIKSFGNNGIGIFDSATNIWRDSSVRTWLNGEFLDSVTSLKTAVVDTPLKTRSQFNATTFIDTTDKVFLLSGADVFGKRGEKGVDAALPNDYTYNQTKLITNAELLHQPIMSVLRDPVRDEASITYISAMNTQEAVTMNYGYGYGVQPAMWLDLTK